MNEQIKVQDIYFELGRVLKAIFPYGELSVYEERIANLAVPAMTIELVEYSTPQHSQNIINKRLDLDIIYYSESDTVFEALKMVDPLMGAFSMGLKVYSRDGDGNILRDDKGKIVYSRFLHCLKAPDYTLVDQDLHFMVTFDWADSFSPTYVTLNEFANDGGAGERKEIVTDFNTSDQILDNKDIAFDADADGEKHKVYVDEPYMMMEDLHTNLNTMQAVFEIKKG